MRLIKLLGVMLVGLWLMLMTSAQEDYSADDGFFSVTIPDGWSSDTSAGYLNLTNDSSNINIYLVTLDATDSDSAITSALDTVGVTYGAQVSANDAPLPNGVWRQVVYSNGSQLALGLAQLQDGRALVLLVAGEQADIQAVNPQLLSILTSITVGETELPAYVDTESFTERDVEFGADPYTMQGTLSIPLGESAFPAVIIVHGSGPSDRNGTVGILAPYRDLAKGLASQGIAVLRYDKRTLTYGAQIPMDNTFTIDAESTDDALLAIDFLKAQPEIDANRIFVLGHSQGAGLAPRIIERADGVAGGMILSGATRSFSDVVRDQIAYITDVNPDALTNPAIVGLQTIVDNYDRVAAGASYDDVFGAQAAYFESLANVAPVATAQTIDAPLLILQGERDYQVTMTDFSGWQEAFADSDRVTLKSYPALNHMFMSQGDLSRLGIPQDYDIPAFVSAEVIQDIADWVDSIGA